jgi:hypothetical protein
LFYLTAGAKLQSLSCAEHSNCRQYCTVERAYSGEAAAREIASKRRQCAETSRLHLSLHGIHRQQQHCLHASRDSRSGGCTCWVAGECVSSTAVLLSKAAWPGGGRVICRRRRRHRNRKGVPSTSQVLLNNRASSRDREYYTFSLSPTGNIRHSPLLSFLAPSVVIRAAPRVASPPPPLGAARVRSRLFMTVVFVVFPTLAVVLRLRPCRAA